ncbi:MAG: hypothetical protein JZU63_11085, partial [Rhodoferax sp.]|nr:hypothetical protein [Rhodoferax sp.]
NVLVELDILVGGVAPLQTAWSVWTGVEIASGTGPRIKFLPVAPTTTYIDVMALDGAGVGHRQSFTVQVFDRPTTVL